MKKTKDDPKTKGAETLSFLALFFFILGIIFGKLFLYNRKDNIEESKLEIGIIMKDLQDKKGEPP